MPGITLAQAEAQLELWLGASTAVAKRQSYTIGDRSLTLADAGEIRDQVTYWDKKVKELSNNGGRRLSHAVPL